MPNIEELLRKAMEEGKFDNLPGKGKPLPLGESNPHADPEWELAYRMLKEAGYSLPWIETMREIEKDIEAARAELQIAWELHQAYRANYTRGGSIGTDWERSQQSFRDKVVSINQRIRDYNLEVPNPRFQRPLLNYEGEIAKITLES